MTSNNRKYKPTVQVADTQYLAGDIGLVPGSFLKKEYAFTVIELGGVLFAIKNTGNGVEMGVVSGKQLPANIKFLTPMKPYTEQEKTKISTVAVSMLVEKSTRVRDKFKLSKQLANFVRANTFDILGEIKGNKYYRDKIISK